MAGSDPLPWIAGAGFLACRIAYVGIVARWLRAEERGEGRARRYGPEEGYRRFRRGAAVLMHLDAAAFVAFCLVTRGTLPAPEGAGPWLLAAGAALSAVGLGVKAWAASCLPEGAYYWRDFFILPPAPRGPPRGPYRFLPHPMYTVGYAHTYGLALGVASLPGLLGAVLAQALMLLLAHLVEDRHWRRVDGGP